MKDIKDMFNGNLTVGLIILATVLVANMGFGLNVLELTGSLLLSIIGTTFNLVMTLLGALCLFKSFFMKEKKYLFFTIPFSILGASLLVTPVVLLCAIYEKVKTKPLVI